MARAVVRVVSNAEAVLAAVERAQQAAMLAAVNELRNEVLKTLSGKRTGRRYPVPGTGGRRHYVASAPGEPPARRLGDLARSIKTEVERTSPSTVEGRVGSTLEYSKYLEFGTRNMAPRPFMRPSTDRALPRIKEALAERGRWSSYIK